MDGSYLERQKRIAETRPLSNAEKRKRKSKNKPKAPVKKKKKKAGPDYWDGDGAPRHWFSVDR